MTDEQRERMALAMSVLTTLIQNLPHLSVQEYVNQAFEFADAMLAKARES